MQSVKNGPSDFPVQFKCKIAKINMLIAFSFLLIVFSDKRHLTAF
jgi:hypothetical protein